MIFVSYAREDKAWVETLVAALQKRFELFWDPELPIGQPWDDEIQRELKLATRVLVVWSAVSIESRYVKEEAQMALDARKLVPVRSENVAPPFGFKLEQCCDLFDWNGDPEDPTFLRLVSALEGPLTPPPPPPPPYNSWARALRRFARSPAVRAAALTLLVVGVAWKLVDTTKADEVGTEVVIGRRAVPSVVAGPPTTATTATSTTVAATIATPPPTAAPAASTVNPPPTITPPPPIPPKRCCNSSTGARESCEQPHCADCGLKDCSKKP